MSASAIVIGIERYERVAELNGPSADVPGAVAEAQLFLEWLERDRGVAPARISLHLSPRPPVGAREATRAAIKDAVWEIIERGGDDEVFVYFSGHGLAVGTDVSNEDTLVLADFADLERSGDAILRISELTGVLRMAGPGSHYFFLDCCRNKPTRELPNIAGLGLTPKASRRGYPSQLTIYATSPGRRAAASANGEPGAFTRALVDGLRGRAARALEWRTLPSGEALVVSFKSLFGFVASRLAADQVPFPTTWGSGGEILATVAPDSAPRVSCTIAVSGVDPDDSISVNVSRRGPGKDETLSGGVGKISVLPGEYTLTPLPSAYEFLPPERIVDLFDATSVDFAATPVYALPDALDLAPAERGPASSGASFRLFGDRATLRIEDATGGDLTSRLRPFGGELEIELDPGTYRLSVLEPQTAEHRADRSWVALEKTIRVVSGAMTAFSLARELPEDATRRAFIDAFGHKGGWLDWPEIGPIACDRLSLWLSLLGASWVAGQHCPLEIPRRASGYRSPGSILVLAAIDDVGARRHPEVLPGPPGSLDGWSAGLDIPGVAAAVWDALTGPFVVSWESDRGSASMPIHVARDHVTLVVLVDRPGEPRSRNIYLLKRPDAAQPVRMLLEAMLRAEAAQWSFARGIAPSVAIAAEEPLTACLSLYAALRVGDAEARASGRAREMLARIGGLDGLPDIAALTRLIDPSAPPLAAGRWPIVLDGFLAASAGELPGEIDRSGPWTAWWRPRERRVDRERRP